MDTKDKNQESQPRRKAQRPAKAQPEQPRKKAPAQGKAAESARPGKPKAPPQPEKPRRKPDQEAPKRRPKQTAEAAPVSVQPGDEVFHPEQKKAAAQRPARNPERQRKAPQPVSDAQHPAAKRSFQLGGHHMHAAKQPTASQLQQTKKLLTTATKKERTLKKNSLQSFISGVKGEKAEAASRQERAEHRQKQRAAQEAKRRRQAQRDNTPAVIYTQPAAFNRNRLFVQLLTVTAVVMALILALSVFFKVKTITVSGAEVYSPWSVREASGIQEGDNLLTFSRARASAQIRAGLPYVDKVRIGIKLPETVIIYIEELSVAYAIKSSDGDWWLINSDGRVVEQVDGPTAQNYTQVLGVTIMNPAVNEDAIATENAPTEFDEEGQPLPVLVTGAQRLFSALQILKALEANDIVGEAASVDVSLLESVVLWYGTRYQVNLGDTNRMEYKIACMNDTILQLSDYQSGILDVSFTVWPNQVGYTPFS